MIDTDAAIRSVLEQLVQVRGEPDWDEVLASASAPRRSPRARRPLALVLVVAGLVAASFATPLGAALVHGLGGFSNWITGEPGRPAPKTDQQQFNQSNAHSWLGFPTGTKLRRLITTHANGETITLDGFRNGASQFCLRLSAKGTTTAGTLECAPIADLQRQDAPVRVLIADRPVGRGTKTEWYGLDRIHSAALQMTAGIAADSVRSVVLVDDHGRHVVPVRSNSFLYVAADPDVGQQVKTVGAQTKTGTVAVPFVPVPFGFGGGGVAAQNAPTVKVASPARSGHIAWLEQHAPRGEPLSVLPARLRSGLLGYRGGRAHSRILFGRMLTPDPNQPLRIAVTLNASRHGGRPAGICTALITKGGAGGGCSSYPGVFATTPFTFSMSGGGSAQFNQVAGVASDAVARVQVLLDDGQTLPAALHDNAFLVAVPVAHLPARLVAYDKQGIVIGASEPIGGFGGGPNPAPGQAKEILAVKGSNGAHAELFVGPATGGGQCTYVKTYISRHVGGVGIGCSSASQQAKAVQLIQLSEFVVARVRPGVVEVRLDYAHGASTTLRVEHGYVLAALPPRHLARANRVARLVGLNSAGRAVGVEAIPAPPKKRAGP